MPPASLYVSVSQVVYRAIPGAPKNDPFDPSFAARSDQNRWNVRRDATLCVAGDPRVLAAEWARHVQVEELASGLRRTAKPRRIYEIDAMIDLVVDLRNLVVCDALELVEAPLCFLHDESFCQRIATRLRRQSEAREILARSKALLDQPERWVIVIFADKLPTYPASFLTSIRAHGTLPAIL
jgi:hypothetical protein